MADFDAQIIPAQELLLAEATGFEGEIVQGGSAPEEAYEYLMVWSDVDCGSPTPRYWYATIEDTSGTQYTGPKCGATPITDAAVLARIATG